MEKFLNDYGLKWVGDSHEQNKEKIKVLKDIVNNKPM